jgi:hypothetical protein
METYLRHGVHLCFVDEGAIFLDIPANTYLSIDAATKAALMTSLVGLAPASGSQPCCLHSGLPEGVTELLRRGLITDSPSAGRPFSPLTVSMTRAVPFGMGRSAAIRIRAMHLVRFVVALIPASIRIRRGHLSLLAARVLTLKAGLSNSLARDSTEVVALVHIFRRLTTLFYTSRNACLLDSAVLTEFLLRYGHRPMLVLGVRTKPFLAHAWVQMGDCVLNDSLEHAQTLTPIAAL